MSKSWRLFIWSSDWPNKQVKAKKPSIAICSRSSPTLTGLTGSERVAYKSTSVSLYRAGSCVGTPYLLRRSNQASSRNHSSVFQSLHPPKTQKGQFVVTSMVDNRFTPTTLCGQPITIIQEDPCSPVLTMLNTTSPFWLASFLFSISSFLFPIQAFLHL